MITTAELSVRLQRFPRLPREEIDPKLVAEQGFGALPEGVEGLYLVRARHPFAEHLMRVDEVAEGMRAAHAAELAALGYELLEQRPVAVQLQRKVGFPHSAMADHPDAVNALREIARTLEQHLPLAASKPGRVEGELHRLLPGIRAIDGALVVPFYDRLIDFYLDAGNANYANRQAKEVIAAMGSELETRWLVERVHQLLARGFYSSLLVDTALDAVAKAEGAAAALELHLAVIEGILKNQIKPNVGTLKAVQKRAKAQNALARLDAVLLPYLEGFLLEAPAHKELDLWRHEASAAMDRLPEAQRLSTIGKLLAYALGDAGDVPVRCRLWSIMTERLPSFPALGDGVAQLAFLLCKNIRFGHTSKSHGIEKSFRVELGQFLQTLPPEVIERNLDSWAATLEDYEEWARQWFFDTFVTMEEMAERHPALFKHPGIIRACTKGLALGVVTSANEEEFLERLLAFIDLTHGTAPRVDDFVRLAQDVIADPTKTARLEPIVRKLAARAPKELQQIFVRLGQGHRFEGEPIMATWRVLAQCAQWMTAPTRQSLRQAVGDLDLWALFIHEAFDNGLTITPQHLWMQLDAIKRLTFREDVMSALEYGGKRYLALGKGDYEGTLNLLEDGELLHEVSNLRRDGHTMQTAKLQVCDGQVRALVLFGDDDGEPWEMRALTLSGEVVGTVALGTFLRVFFARHKPWLVGLTRDRCVVFDYEGVAMAEHDLALRQVGDWDDFYGVVHPLQKHLLISGPTMTLVFGEDATTPTRLAREIEGGIERAEGLALLVFDDKKAALLDRDGNLWETMDQHPNGHLCGQCEKLHYSRWTPTNLRGVPGELLTEGARYQGQLVNHRREHRGWVSFANGQAKYRVEWSVRDLDGDGFDEVYLFDFAGKVLTVQRDPAAALRQALQPYQGSLAASKVERLALGQGDSSAALHDYIAAEIAAHGPHAASLGDGAFAPVLAMLAQLQQSAEALVGALETVAQSFPEEVVNKELKLPRSEVTRLKKLYLSGQYAIEQYPLAKALQEGTIESYRPLLCRNEVPGGEEHPNQPFLRTLIGKHLQMAREVGLEPPLRARVLDLVEQLLDLAEDPATWLTVSAKEREGGHFNVSEAQSEDCVVNKRINEAVREILTGFEKRWKLGAFEWSTAPSDSIYDLELRGLLRLGDATLKVGFGMNQGETFVCQDEPYLGGPVAAVRAALDQFDVVAHWHPSHAGEPARAWGGEQDNPWEPLDEWMIPEEIASLRREVAQLRTLDASESTVGPAAHRGLLALMASTWGLKEDTAKVLAPLVLQSRFDREGIACWSGIDSKKLLPHFKALVDAKLIEKAEGNEYLFTTPKVVGQGYRNQSTTAFKRLFFTIAPMEGQRANGRTKVARCFSEADVLRHYLMHVGQVSAEAIEQALAGPLPAASEGGPATSAGTKKSPAKKSPAKKSPAKKSPTPKATKKS